MKATKRALLSSVMALFLCFTMLLGTTYAWFTDEVTSANNIIQSGSLKVGFQHALGTEDPDSAAWENVSGALFDYSKWEPGYAVAKHLKVSNEGTLALNYKLRITADGVVTKLADVIDVYVLDGTQAVTRDIVNAATPIGTLTQVLLGKGADDAQDPANKGVSISEIIKGSLKAGDDPDVYTIVLKMREEADNKYQNMDLGSTFSVQLIATQMSAESDSFNKLYDETVPNEEIPAALVRPLDNLNVNYTVNGWGNSYSVINKDLDVAYGFQPTEDEVDLSFYQHWMADFVVSADKDVPAKSMALAGYYSAICDLANNGNWVALTHDGVITAGTEIPLVETMGWPVHYSDILNFGTDGIGFRCGAVDLTGENAGTTLTVELRIYETEAEWDDSSASSVKTGRYITIGKFTYTFPAAEAKDQASLEDALEAGAPLINVAAGTYTFPNTQLKEGVTLVCEDGTVFDGKTGFNIGGATVVGATFTNDNDYLAEHATINGTFKDCVFTNCDGLRYCYAGDTVVFENCVFDTDFYGVHFDSGANDVVFKNCTFTGFNTFGSAITKLTMENCTFKYNGKGGYNGINLWGNSELKNCTFVFDGSASYEWVDLCGDNQTVTFTGCVISDGTTERPLATGDVGDYGTGNTITVQ